MPLFGHGHHEGTTLRPNESVLGHWRTHQGELQLTNQRCLLLKGEGLGGLVPGAHHEVAWQVELLQIQNMQIVGGQEGSAPQGEVRAAFGQALSDVGLGAGAQLIINGMGFHFHEASHANQAQAQITSAGTALAQNTPGAGGAPPPPGAPAGGLPPPPPPPPP